MNIAGKLKVPAKCPFILRKTFAWTNLQLKIATLSDKWYFSVVFVDITFFPDSRSEKYFKSMLLVLN